MRYPYGGRLIRGTDKIWSDTFVSSTRSGYLDAFKKYSRGVRGINPKELTEDEWWALGRHYGLITPLLDWTEVPYIAVFFAIVGLHEAMSAQVGGLRFDGRSAAVFRLIDYPDIEGGGLRVIRPVVEELGRMHNQRGVFTFLDSEEFFELESFLEHRGRAQHLTKFVLSDQVLIDAHRELRHAGIDARLVYPDLHGAALAANQRFSLPQ